MGEWVAVGPAELRRRDRPEVEHGPEHRVPPRPRGLRVRNGVVAAGICGKAGEERRLSERESLCVVAEVGERGLVDAVGAVSEVDRVQVGREDLLLRPLLLELPGERRFAELAADRALVLHVRVLDELLRDRRAALHDTLVGDVGPDGTTDRPEVDPPVLEVTAVLDRDDCLLHHRRDVVVVDEDPVLVPAQDCEDPLARRVVDLCVGLRLPLRLELGDLARDRGDESEREGRQRQKEEAEREDQQTELPDPAPLLRRRRFSAAAKTQDGGV